MKTNFLVMGYTTQDHLLVDLDNISLSSAKYICKSIQSEWNYLGDCLLVESSNRHYHLVFDDWVEWDELVRIIQILADLNIVQKNYAQVRTFRRDLTLRVSEKHGEDRYRPAPNPVDYITVKHACNRHNGISLYLNALQMFKYCKKA